jgi:hypothetical protein
VDVSDDGNGVSRDERDVNGGGRPDGVVVNWRSDRTPTRQADPPTGSAIG